MAPSSLVLKIPAAWVSPSILRSFTKLTSRRSRSSSSIPEKFDTLEKEIGALEHLLKGGNSTYASEDIRESVLIYEGGDKEYLRGMLKDLQREKTELQIEKTALITGQAAVESIGTLREEYDLKHDIVLRCSLFPDKLFRHDSKHVTSDFVGWASVRSHCLNVSNLPL